ncbi:MAG TPA: hypothetical protein VGW10_03385 [Solirubrobacteraceae bacterium]|nr:hypothetical protein [Solirubrobacteraceae bacterium]
MNAFSPADLPDADARARRLRGLLLAELDDAPSRRRLPARAALVAASLAAVLAVAAGFLATNDADPALAVERDDGWLVLRIAAVDAGAEAMTRELRDAGIRGEVRLLPVAAEDVGTWAIISERAKPPGEPTGPGTPSERETVRLNSVRYERETLRIPVAELRESTGYFVFYAGREARPGEELRRDGEMHFLR